MKRWALVSDGYVINVVEQDVAPTTGAWVECTNQPIGPGCTWNGSVFGPVPATVYKLIKTTAFWDRFSNGELVDYDVAMQHDPSASSNAKKSAAKLRIFRQSASDDGFVKLGSSKTVTFVADLETSGVIAAGRAVQITGTPITPDEAYLKA